MQTDERVAQELREEEERERAEREARMREMRSQEDAERAEREKEKNELIDRLQSSDAPAHKLVKQARTEAQKRVQRATAGLNLGARSASGLLRSRAAMAVPDPPHVPLSDDWWDYSDRFTLRDNYDDPMSDAVRADVDGIFRAGGYRVEESWERAIRFAVAGLDLRPLDSSPDVVMSTA